MIIIGTIVATIAIIGTLLMIVAFETDNTFMLIVSALSVILMEIFTLVFIVPNW